MTLKQPPPGAVPLEKQEHRTYHLVPAEYWEGFRSRETYLPEPFDTDGFIHCAETIEEVIAVGNRYYQSDPRNYQLLEIDCAMVDAPIVYEDAGHVFPHIYGVLPVRAVHHVFEVERDGAGQFLKINGAK